MKRTVSKIGPVAVVRCHLHRLEQLIAVAIGVEFFDRTKAPGQSMPFRKCHGFPAVYFNPDRLAELVG